LVEAISAVDYCSASALVGGLHRVETVEASVVRSLVGQSRPAPVDVEEVFLVVAVDGSVGDLALAELFVQLGEVPELSHVSHIFCVEQLKVLRCC